MNAKRLRLKWKVFMFLLGFCALLLIILWLFQTVLLEPFYKNIRELEVKREAGVIAQALQSDHLKELIADIAASSDLSIDLTDMDGRSLLSAASEDNPIITENAKLIAQAQAAGGEYHAYMSPPPQPPETIEKAQYLDHRRQERMPGRRPQSLYYVKLVDAGSAIVVRAIITPVNATVTTLRMQLIIVSGIMLLLSVLFAIVVAKRVSGPIEEITKSAEALAKGQYDTRFNGKRFYEIAVLADTLNTAALELGRVEGFRRDLLANVSHDLRTPLALIYSYAEMINDFPDETTPEQMRVIMNETKRLTTLVNDVLDLSKLQSDMGQLNAAPYNLTKNIRLTVERIGTLLESEGFNIIFHYDGDVVVTADETKIDRVFYNLLINAVNYSGESRKITVTQTVHTAENTVRIAVEDGGEGIPEKDLPYIWERYYKNGKKHKRAVTGSGLGLSIVKKIIEMHGGGYGVTSEFGKGSIFWFEIGIR